MFLSKLRASDDRSPWSDFWFQPLGTGSLSGARVTPDSAMQLSAVYRAVVLLSGHMAMLPLRFYKAGTRIPITRHPLLTLLNKKPNRWQNAFEWGEMVQGHLELRGNAYNEIYIDKRGNITELIPRHPDKVKIEQLENGDYRYRVTEPNGTTRSVPREQIWHLRGFSSNGILGMSVIECAAASVGAGLAAQNYAARFFANDAKPTGGWVEFPGQFANKEARQQFREQMQEAQSDSNRGKLMVLDRGMKYHEVGVSNTDAQFLESRKFTISDIARWFGVPPHKIGDLEKATFSNIEQQSLEYVQDGLQPRARRWEASIIADLLLDDEEIDAEFDFTELLRGDSISRANYITKMVNGGILTRNEGREIERREPLPGLDEPLRPLNMVEEGDAEDAEDDVEQAESPKQEVAEPGESGESARRLQAMLNGNASRLARRIVKAKGEMPSAELIAESLSISSESATAWVAAHWGLSLNEIDLTASLMQLAGENK